MKWRTPGRITNSLHRRLSGIRLNLRHNWQFYVLFIIVLAFIKYHSLRIDQTGLENGDILFIESKAHQITAVIYEDGVAHYHTRKVWGMNDVVESHL
jgi:hypothetical protein